MKTILSYPLTFIYYLNFLLLLLIFHPIQMLCYHLGGYASHKKSVEILNFLLINNMRVLGCRIRFEGFSNIPNDKPYIIVANHQSTMDIPPVVWGLRNIHPKFISKIELAKGIPSISYNLRKSKSAIIERKNGSQSIREIIRLGRYIQENNYSACIFPEGTRSKTGKMRKFQAGGIQTLLKVAPSAYILPMVIDGNYNLEKNGKFPLTLGAKLSYKILNPINPKDYKQDQLIVEVENQIRQELNQ